jgi:hypothetical protein
LLPLLIYFLYILRVHLSITEWNKLLRVCLLYQFDLLFILSHLLSLLFLNLYYQIFIVILIVSYEVRIKLLDGCIKTITIEIAKA